MLEQAAAEDHKWRMRKKVLKCISSITLSLGGSVFKAGILELFLRFVTDSVYQIRKASVQTIKNIKELIDVDWILSVFYPKLFEIYQESYWYLKKTCIIQVLGSLNGDYVNLMTSASKDPVANVRLAVCKLILEKNKENKEISPYSK